MRIKEWYSWHFPELVKIVSDNYTYVRLAILIQVKNKIVYCILIFYSRVKKISSMKFYHKLKKLPVMLILQEKLLMLLDLQWVKSSVKLIKFTMIILKLKSIFQATLLQFAAKVVSGFEYRNDLQQYLKDRMNNVAPSLTAFIGENVI